MSESSKILTLIQNDLKFLLHLLTRLDPESEHIIDVMEFFNGLADNKKNMHKIALRINSYFKEGDKTSKISFPHQHNWVSGIEKDDISLFNSQEQLFSGIPIQFVLAKRQHQTLCWMYFRSVCYLSDMYLMILMKDNNKNDEKTEQYYTKAKGIFRQCLVERMEYEHEHEIDKIIDKELLNSSNKKKMDDAIKAANKVKELFNQNNSSDRVIGTIVDSLAKKLGELETDDDGGILNLVNIAREVAMDVGGKINKDDINMEELMKRSREAGAMVYQNTPEHEKDKLNSNPIMRDLVKNLEDPTREINMENIQNLMSTHGLDPMEAAKQLGMEDKILEIQRNLESETGAAVSIEELMAKQNNKYKK